MHVVYLDVLFLFNFAVDFLLLKLTSVISNSKTKMLRIIIAASVGGIYACIIYFTELGAFSVLAKVFGALICTALCFENKTARAFIKRAVLLLIVTFSFGGGFYGLYSFFGDGKRLDYENGVPYLEIPPLLFITLFAVLYGLIKISYFIYAKRNAVTKEIKTIIFQINNETFETKALIDTGNNLCEPFSGRQVLLVQNPRLEKMIREEKEKVYIIPYKSIGKSSDILLGLKTERAEAIGSDNRRIDLSGIIVAPTSMQLSNDGEFNGLIGEKAFTRI